MSKNQDKLENFILKNRTSFEENFNDDQVLKGIENNIKPKKSDTLRFNWLAAASVFLLLAVGWLVTERYYLNQKVNELEHLTVAGKNFTEIENFYTQVVTQKTELLREKSSSNNLSIETDLNKLQSEYEELKKQLQKGIPHEKIINAMIYNLRAQVEILENHLEILENLKEYTSHENNNKNEISI